MYYTHLQYRANELRSGRDVTDVDGVIRQYKEWVVEYEEEIKQHQQRLLEMEQEEGWSLDRLVCNFMVISYTVTVVHLNHV